MKQLINYNAHILPVQFNSICLRLQLISQNSKIRCEINITRYDVNAAQDKYFAVLIGTPHASYAAFRKPHPSLGFRSLKTHAQAVIPNSNHLPAKCEIQIRYNCIQILALPHPTKSLTVLLI